MSSYDPAKGLIVLEGLEEQLASALPGFVERYGDAYRVPELLMTRLLGSLVNFMEDALSTEPENQVAIMRTISGVLEPLAAMNDVAIDMLLMTGFFEDLWILGSARTMLASELRPQMTRILHEMQRQASEGSKTISDPMSP